METVTFYIGLVSLCAPAALFIIGGAAIGIGYVADWIKFRKLTPQLLFLRRMWQCPNCKTLYHMTQEYKYCPECGKKIDWSNISF